jgi:hypothetical protein
MKILSGLKSGKTVLPLSAWAAENNYLLKNMNWNVVIGVIVGWCMGTFGIIISMRIYK